MKIAFVFDSMIYGGVERVGLDYTRLLKSKGYEIDVYILNPSQVEDIIKEFPEGCTIKKIPFSNKICPESYWRVAKVFCWGKYIFPIIYPFLRILLWFFKLLVRPNKKYDIVVAFSGHLNDLTFVAYDFLKSKKKCCWLHGGLYAYMVIVPGFECLYKKIKNLVVLTDFAQEECLFLNKSLDLNLRKIYNPSFIKHRPIDPLKVEKLNKAYGSFILMVARISSQKNHLDLIRAVEHIYIKYKKKYNLVFVGDGPSSAHVKDFANNSKIKEHCFFEGNQEDPQNYYAAANLFALSSYSEGLPTVLIEAACFGLPLVSSDTSVREILGNNEYGLISPIGEYELLAENIYSLLSDDKLYKKYSDAARQRHEEFAPDKIANQVESFFKTLR